MGNEIINVEMLLEKRIKENEKLFTKDEIKLLIDNKNLIKKIYLLGALDMI